MFLPVFKGLDLRKNSSKRFSKETLKICYSKLKWWPLDDWKPKSDICCYHTQKCSCRAQVSPSIACKTESLSALSSSRNFTLYPYVMQDISVFKLQSQHLSMEYSYPLMSSYSDISMSRSSGHFPEWPEAPRLRCNLQNQSFLIQP